MVKFEEDVFDFSVEFSAEDIVDYDSLEKSNEFENIEIVLEKDETLNAVDLHEKFDEEDLYVGFVSLTFMNEDSIPLVRTDGVPKQTCASPVTSFINMNISTKNTLNLAISS